MLSVPVMTEVSDNCKRNVPAVDYVLNDEQVTATAAGQANNSVQVNCFCLLINALVDCSEFFFFRLAMGYAHKFR